MEDYGGTGKGDFIKREGFYVASLNEAIQGNTVWLPDTKLYREYIYDPEQVAEEERKEREELEKQEMMEAEREKEKMQVELLVLGKKEMDIKETKDHSKGSGSRDLLNESISRMLKNLEK